MGTTAEKLAYLDATKTAIKDAIVAKGVEVPENTTFRGYADLISGISTGLSDDALALATATPEDVMSGKTFYAGDKTLRTGRALATATNVTAAKMFAGVTAYNQQGQLITGNPTATTATAADIVSGKTAYNNLGQLMMGSGIGKIISGTIIPGGRIYFNGTIIMAGIRCSTHIAGIVTSSGTSCAMGNTSRRYGVLRLYTDNIYWEKGDNQSADSGTYWIIYKD